MALNQQLKDQFSTDRIWTIGVPMEKNKIGSILYQIYSSWITDINTKISSWNWYTGKYWNIICLEQRHVADTFRVLNFYFIFEINTGSAYWEQGKYSDSLNVSIWNCLCWFIIIWGSFLRYNGVCSVPAKYPTQIWIILKGESHYKTYFSYLKHCPKDCKNNFL